MRLETAPTVLGTAKLTHKVRLETAPTVPKIRQIPLIGYKLKAAKPKTRIHEIYFQKNKNELATIEVFLPIRSYRCYKT